jgi:hypothetical protein
MGDDDAGEAVLMQQRSSRGRLYGKGVKNTGGKGGMSPSVRSWDSSSCTLEDARAEGSRLDGVTARREGVLAYAKACQQLQHDGKARLGFEWLDRWMHPLT